MVAIVNDNNVGLVLVREIEKRNLRSIYTTQGEVFKRAAGWHILTPSTETAKLIYEFIHTSK